MTVTVNAIWLRIRLHEGATFYTKSGSDFTYSVSGDETTGEDVLYTDAAKSYAIPKRLVGEMLHALPIDHPDDYRNETQVLYSVRYAWAILHDERIRMGDY